VGLLSDCVDVVVLNDESNVLRSRFRLRLQRPSRGWSWLIDRGRGDGGGGGRILDSVGKVSQAALICCPYDFVGRWRWRWRGVGVTNIYILRQLEQLSD